MASKIFLKRLFDILIACGLLIVLSPAILLVGILVYLRLGSPIIFRQERVGHKERVFTIMKFRTMLEEGSEHLSDNERLTKFGQFLRSTSLDELPELLNVIKGDMSLVGPRPLLVQYLPLYSMHQARRHEVRPGLTGWAQINGRNAVTWKEKFDLDVWYVENRSLLLDIKILILTLWKVIRRDGINADGEATMPYFTGDN